MSQEIDKKKHEAIADPRKAKGKKNEEEEILPSGNLDIFESADTLGEIDITFISPLIPVRSTPMVTPADLIPTRTAPLKPFTSPTTNFAEEIEDVIYLLSKCLCEIEKERGSAIMEKVAF